MLILGLGVGMIIAGLMALVRGRLQLSRSKAVQGVPARLLGVALLTPLPLGFLAAMVYALFHVNPNDPAQVEQWTTNNEMTLNLIVAGVEIGLGLLIVLVAAFLAKPLAETGAPEKDYDDYERPRRRRVEDEDDRPRGQRYDDEDDRPRRSDDLDDRAR